MSVNAVHDALRRLSGRTNSVLKTTFKVLRRFRGRPLALGAVVAALVLCSASRTTAPLSSRWERHGTRQDVGLGVVVAVAVQAGGAQVVELGVGVQQGDGARGVDSRGRPAGGLRLTRLVSILNRPD